MHTLQTRMVKFTYLKLLMVKAQTRLHLKATTFKVITTML